MKFKYTARLDPPWPFGLPFYDEQVVPGGKQIQTHPIEAGTGHVIGYGTLPLYRKEEEKVSVARQIEGVEVKVEDNFVFFELVSDSGEKAYEQVVSLLSDITSVLTYWFGFQITFEVLSGWDENRNPAPVRSAMYFKFKFYNLDQCRVYVENALAITPIKDPVLKKSLEYYNHAVFLYDTMRELEYENSLQQKYLLSDIALNLTKSVQTIVGDPSKGRDRDYQTRYKKYGIDYIFWRDRINRLKKVRDTLDVAHYHVTDEKLKELNSEIRECLVVTRETISKYIEYLSREEKKPTQPLTS